MGERDLEAIVHWIIDHAGSEAADRRLREIERAIGSLAQTPHKGSIRDDILPGLRSIPAGRKAVIAFTTDDTTREVCIQAVSYGGADWAVVSRSRRR